MGVPFCTENVDELNHIERGEKQDRHRYPEAPTQTNISVGFPRRHRHWSLNSRGPRNIKNGATSPYGMGNTKPRVVPEPFTSVHTIRGCARRFNLQGQSTTSIPLKVRNMEEVDIYHKQAYLTTPPSTPLAHWSPTLQPLPRYSISHGLLSHHTPRHPVGIRT